jgi:hypothetical protein
MVKRCKCWQAFAVASNTIGSDGSPSRPRLTLIVTSRWDVRLRTARVITFPELVGLKLRTKLCFGIKRRMMDVRRAQFILFAGIVLLAGRRQPIQSAEGAPPESQPTPAQTVARIHWLGLNRLSQETNAASLMAIWNLPESSKLEQQTLNKLSLAPWPLLHRDLDPNAAALLRPLLNDVISNESCLEIQETTNQPGEVVFAVRLDDRRAALWQTNLAAVLESLTGIQPVPAPDNRGWSLEKHHVPNRIELTRAGAWALLGAAEDHNRLLGEFQASIQHGQAPFRRKIPMTGSKPTLIRRVCFFA